MNKQAPDAGPLSVIDSPLNIKPAKEAGGPDVPANENAIVPHAENTFHDPLGLLPVKSGGKPVGPAAHKG